MKHRIQFCSGGNVIPGWINHDIDCDIRKRLPYEDQSTEFIFCEHGLEHVTQREAWLFLEECHRILVPGGVARIAIPDLTRMSIYMNAAYAAAVQRDVGGDGTFKSALRACMFEHGHLGLWNTALLRTVMSTIGFTVVEVFGGYSPHLPLRDIESHGKVVGEDIAGIETSILEAAK